MADPTLDFDTIPSYPARKDDPETSHEAARDKLMTLRESQAAVHAQLAERGPYGATAGELADRIGVPRDWIGPRLTELELGGRVRSEGKRLYRRSGKNQKVWFFVK